MDNNTYSYLILKRRQTRKCNNVHPTSIKNTYNVIRNAEPMNCFRSTANPMVARKHREIKSPRSRLPRSFLIGFNCARQIETVVTIRSLPAFQKASGKILCAIIVVTNATPKPIVKSHAISLIAHFLSAINGSVSPSSSSSGLKEYGHNLFHFLDALKNAGAANIATIKGVDTT